MLFELQGLWYNAAQRIRWKVDVGRTGLTALAERARDCFVELLQHQRRFAHRARVARDGSHQLRVIHILQTTPILLWARIASRYYQYRRT